MNRFISAVLAFVMAFSGIVSQQFSDTVAKLYSRFTGISLYGDTEDISFLDKLTDSDYESISGDLGYMKSTLLLFLDSGVGPARRLKIFSAAGGRAIGYHALANLYIVKTDASSYDEITEVCDKLSEIDGVLLAAPSGAKRFSPDYTPVDPFIEGEEWNEDNCYGSNWWLEAIEARNAWGYNKYFNHINIGVVDSGFKTDHEELEGKISFPSDKCAGRNRPDDHGTHVAGIIAAKGDNNVGISGVCQNSTLICVDWSAESDQGWISDVEIFFGFGYAVKAGAKVVNFSIGASSNIPAGKDSYASILMNADAAIYSFYMSLLLSRGYDFVVVQSAGNGDYLGRAVDAFDNSIFCAVNSKNCMCPFIGVSKSDVLNRIIVVGNAKVNPGNSFRQVSSSNVGYSVTICAPGFWIYSCTTDEEGYGYMSGTSMSAPVVTGVASLVWSVNPEFTGAQVKSIVCSRENTKYDVLPSDNQYWEGLNYLTYRLVNAKLSVEAAIQKTYSARRISGRFVDEDGEGVEASFDVSGQKSCKFETNSNGEFSFVIPDGSYTVSAIVEKYVPFEHELIVSGSDISSLAFTLTEVPFIPTSEDEISTDNGFYFPAENEVTYS